MPIKAKNDCKQSRFYLKVVQKMGVLHERLQGFPDIWTKYGVDGEAISDSQRYKCCGNAVTVNVVRDIFNAI
jgi:site-specific DNA-cytosine methylase